MKRCRYQFICQEKGVYVWQSEDNRRGSCIEELRCTKEWFWKDRSHA